MTLLKNENSILPLSKGIKKIAVIGPNADDSIAMWGNYNGFPSHTTTILDGITGKLSADHILYDRGCNLVSSNVFISLIDQCEWNGKKGFEATYWNEPEFAGNFVVKDQVTSPFNLNTGGATVYAPGVNLQNLSAKFKAIFTSKSKQEIVLNISGDNGYHIFVNKKKVIDNWGEHAKETSEYVLKAQSGKEYLIEIEYMHAGEEGVLQFNLGYVKEFDSAEIVKKVSDAEVIVFVGGISPQVEGEQMPVSEEGFRDGDRTTIELPKVQRDLIHALKQSGKPIVLVLLSGSALGIYPEANEVDAILQAWYPGQAGGKAIADVIFGDYNPAGRLPITFYKDDSQLPDYQDYSMKGRTYRYFGGDPLYPFGYGLSYTHFNLENVKLSKNNISPGESIYISFTIQNNGKYDGDEVVQIYVHKVDDKEGPLKSLKAFERINLKKGESKTTKLKLPASTFETFDPSIEEMCIIPGRYEVLYGTSSADKDLRKIDLIINN